MENFYYIGTIIFYIIALIVIFMDCTTSDEEKVFTAMWFLLLSFIYPFIIFYIIYDIIQDMIDEYQS